MGPLKNKDGNPVTEDGEMAELLNEFFSSVFTRESQRDVPAAEEMAAEVPSLTVIRSELEVRKKIRKLKPASVAGPDEIGPRLLQELEDEVLTP